MIASNLDLIGLLQTCMAEKLRTTIQLITRRSYHHFIVLGLSGKVDAAWARGQPQVMHRAHSDLSMLPVRRVKIIAAGLEVDICRPGISAIFSQTIVTHDMEPPNEPRQ